MTSKIKEAWTDPSRKDGTNYIQIFKNMDPTVREYWSTNFAEVSQLDMRIKVIESMSD